MECDAAIGIIIKRRKVLMIKRSPNLEDPFLWDIGFPGGRIENRDIDCLDAAIREIREETGIILSRNSKWVELPCISPLTVRMRVKPFIFSLSGDVRLERGSEVEEAFWLDLRELREGYAFIPRRRIITKAFIGAGRIIWGMSYRLLKLLLNTGALEYFQCP